MQLRKIQKSDWASWDRFYRGNFFNSLSGFKPGILIGTKNLNDINNLALISNVVHLGADPALIGYVNRPRAATPHSLSNIEQSGVYTMNLIHPGILQAAHQSSAKYAEDQSEFEYTELTPAFRAGCSAPFVAESFVQWHMTCVEIVPITHNNTFFIIGSIEAVYLPNDWVEEDGFIRLEQGETICTLGLDGYYLPQRIERLPYARPPRLG
jgi:flavin reductase (DIM6/NTAB) family NADH-FMN oxidoreductase RutF